MTDIRNEKLIVSLFAYIAGRDYWKPVSQKIKIRPSILHGLSIVIIPVPSSIININMQWIVRLESFPKLQILLPQHRIKISWMPWKMSPKSASFFDKTVMWITMKQNTLKKKRKWNCSYLFCFVTRPFPVSAVRLPLQPHAVTIPRLCSQFLFQSSDEQNYIYEKKECFFAKWITLSNFCSFISIWFGYPKLCLSPVMVLLFRVMPKLFLLQWRLSTFCHHTAKSFN